MEGHGNEQVDEGDISRARSKQRQSWSCDCGVWAPQSRSRTSQGSLCTWLTKTIVPYCEVLGFAIEWAAHARSTLHVPTSLRHCADTFRHHQWLGHSVGGVQVTKSGRLAPQYTTAGWRQPGVTVVPGTKQELLWRQLFLQDKRCTMVELEDIYSCVQMHVCLYGCRSVCWCRHGSLCRFVCCDECS